MKQGNDLIIMADGIALASSKSCSVTVKADTIETASPTDGDYVTYIADRKSWSVSTTHLVAADTTVRSLLETVGKTVCLTFAMRDNPADSLTGAAICTQCKITATRGNLMQGSFSWKGSGPLVYVNPRQHIVTSVRIVTDQEMKAETMVY